MPNPLLQKHLSQLTAIPSLVTLAKLFYSFPLIPSPCEGSKFHSMIGEIFQVTLIWMYDIDLMSVKSIKRQGSVSILAQIIFC